MKPNVILITIDALAWQRCGFAGYQPSPTPTLDSLAAEGLVWSNAFAMGCPTQFSMPAVFSSSPPLAHGGYEMGVRNRPATLAEAFRDSGYQTRAISCIAPAYGYGRGFDHYTWTGGLSGWLDDSLGKRFRTHHQAVLAEGVRTIDETVAACRPFMDFFYEQLRELANLLRRQADDPTFRRWRAYFRWDYERMFDLIDLEVRWYTENPDDYIVDFLMDKGKICAPSRRILSCGQPDVSREYIEMVEGFIETQHVEKKSILDGASAHNILSRSLSDIDSLDASRPFMTWLHLMDVHNYVFATCDARDEDFETFAEDFREAFAALERIRNTPDFKGYDVYDLAIQYADRQVGKYLNALRERGLLENTIVAIHADHGWAAGYPYRQKLDIADLYDDLYHVPVILHGPGIGSGIVDGLVSLMDLPTTLLGACGITRPNSFEGIVVASADAATRSHVMAEHCGRGPCDPAAKTTKIAARSAEYKMVVAIPALLKGEGAFVEQIYDLRSDPEELTNLAGMEMTPGLEPLLGAIAERGEQIVHDYSAPQE